MPNKGKRISKRVSVIITVIVIIFLIGVSPLKATIAKQILSSRIKNIIGLDIFIEDVDLSILKSWIDIKELEVFNPSRFIGQVMVDIPKIYIDYELGDLMKGKIYIKELEINLRELIIVKNANGELNLNLLNVPYPQDDQKPGSQSSTKDQLFQIDTVRLQIGKVIYKNYSKGDPPKVKEFDLNIDERYYDIKKSSLLTGLILSKIFLSNITVARLVYPDIEHLREEIAQAIREADKLSAEAVEESLQEQTEEKASENPEKILPLGVK